MRDPRTGRFIAAPALPLTSRAADMLASFNEGRDAGRKDGERFLFQLACLTFVFGLTLAHALHTAFR